MKLPPNEPRPSELSDLSAAVARRWQLRLDKPFATARGYVAPALRADGVRCVLKVGSAASEMASEVAALQLWDGHGCCRLLAADPKLGAMLLERVEPGTPLRNVAAVDDDKATHIATDVLRALWRPVPSEECGLRPLEDWLVAYERHREEILAGSTELPVELFRRANAIRAALLVSAPAPVVLHGDLHHENILRSTRAGWLAIDPKGLAGDRCFDVCQFLHNPWPGPKDPRVNVRRLAIFADVLGLDTERLKNWCFVHAILDACWALEDGDSVEEKIAWAQQTLRL